jgi:hypothetical protein
MTLLTADRLLDDRDSQIIKTYPTQPPRSVT